MKHASFYAGLFLAVFFFASCSFDYGTPPEENKDPDLILGGAEYVRIKDGNPEIRIQADEVRRYEAKHVMELDAFSFEQYNAVPEKNGLPAVNAQGKAGEARFETDTSNFYMGGGVYMEVASEKITMETAEISWQDKEHSLSAPGKLSIVRSDGTTMKGTGFSADIRRKSWEFESAVEGAVVDEEDEKDKEENKEENSD